MANKIKYQVDFDVKQNSLNQLKSSLQDLQKMKVSDLVKINNTDINSASNALKSVQQDAKKVENALNKAFNTKLNTLNIQTFNKELASSNLTIEKVYQSFSQIGASGQAAFNNLSAQILNTNVQLRQSSKLLDGMATSMANTIKWGITSSIFKNVTSSIQSAYYYAKDLDRSLTDIRIVTGESADQMERFAKTANDAAKDLGRSTLDYTKAALSFYQQGLSDDQVQARATATLKAENITGMGSQMIDYLTSVWNGFNVQAEQAEEYVDKLAAVADTTASNMGQLATAISKVASTANAMGVDIDQLNGQVATVIATTRQAPESVGVAFKTIYARMNDIKTGADEAQISLGNYSGKMAELGFNVLDATGHLRDTGQVIEEIGSRWKGLTRQQQINLAQTMAGQRQYNNLIALFDNWDKYLQSVNTSMSAQGTLNEKNDRYLESLEAHMQTLGAEAERTYDILFDENTVKGFVDVFDSALKTFNDFISGLGGGTNAFVYFGTTIANIFNKQIAQGIQGVETEIQRLLANINAFNTKAKVIEQVKSGLQAEYAGQGINLGNTALTQQAKAAQKTLAVQKGLTIEQQKQAVQIQKQIGLSQQKINDLEKQKNDAKQIVKSLEQQQIIQGRSIALLQQDRQNLQYSYEINQKSLTTMQGIEKSIDKINSGTLSWQQEGRITENIIQQMKNQSENLKDTWVASGGSVKDFNNHLQTINAYLIGQLDDTEKFKESWEAIKNITQQYANSQKADLEKIDLYLKNIGIDTSKLTDEEKKRLEILLQQNDALAEQGRKTINLQTLIKGISAAGMALTSIGGGISTALADGATAADKLNGTFTAINGTIGAGLSMIPGFGPALNIVWQGVSSIGKSILQATGLWSKFEDHFKSSKERIDELNESINKIHENDKTKNAQIFNLEQVADEYQKLSRKAGEYGSNLDSLTQQEQDRYHQITNSFAEYNQAVIAGYDDQGNAIVKGQDALKDTIEVLKEAKLEADKAALGSKDKVFEGIQASHDSINKDQIKDAQKQVDEISNNLSGLEYDIGDTSGNNGALINYKEKIRDFILSTIPDAEITKEVYQKFETFDELLEQAYKTGNQELYNEAGALGQELNNWVLNKTGVDIAKTEFPDTPSLFKNSENMESLKNQYLNDLTQAQKIRDDLINEAENSKYTQEDANKLIAAFQIFDNDLWVKIEENLKNTGFDSNTLNQIFIDTITSQTVNVKPEELYDTLYNQALEFQETLSTYGDKLSEAQENGLKDIQEKISDNSTVDEINQVIRTSIYDNWLNNPVIQEMMNDANSRNFILELIKSVYNLDDIEVLEHYGNWVVKTLTTQMDKVMKQLPNALLSPIQGVTLDQTPLESWLRENFQPEEVQQIIDDLIANPQTFDSLQSFQDYVNNFFENLNKEQEADKFIENVDKVITALKKLQDGKDLSYKEKVNLMTALGLDADQVNNIDSIISKLETSLDKLKDSDAPEDALKRAEILSSIYDSYEKIDDAYQRGIISNTQASGLRQDVYNNELESLNLTEQALQEFAAANNLAFGDQQSNRKALAIYKQTQSLDSLKNSVEKASQKFKTLKEEGTDPFKDSQALGYLQQLDTLLSDLGINVDYSWIINNIDKISEALKNGTVNAQNLTKALIENTKLPAQASSTAVDQFNQGRTDIQNLQGARDSLQKHNALSDDQLAILAKISMVDSELAKIAEEQGTSSEDYLQRLDQIIEAKKLELELTKQQALAENEARQAELLAKRGQLWNEAEKKRSEIGISEDQYNKAKNDFDENPMNYQASQTIRIYEEQLADVQEQLKDNQQDLIKLGAQRLAIQQDLEEVKQKQLDKDVNKDEWQNLSNQLQNLAPQSEQLSNDLAENKDIADDLSQSILRFDDACKNVVDSYEDWIKALQSGSIQQQAEAISELRDAYGDLLDLDGSSLSEGFLSNKDNLDLMKEAIDGNIDSYDQLMQLAQQDIAVQAHVDTNEFENGLNNLLNEYYNVENLDDLEIGASLNDEGFLAGLSEMLSATELTSAQAQDLLGTMGMDAEVIQTTVPSEESKQVTGFHGSAVPMRLPYSIPFANGFSMGVEQGMGVVTGVEWIPDQNVVTDKKQTKATSLKVTSASKSSGGGFKFTNAKNGGGSLGAARRSPSGSGRSRGGGGKGGGSGKAVEPDTSKKDKKKPLEDQRDIYHDINIELQQINRQLNRMQEKQDKLYGKQLLDNLNKQQRILEKQKDTLERKAKIQKQDLKDQQDALKNLGVTFDSQGNISNYMSILGKKQSEINQLIRKENGLIKQYNKNTNKEQKEAISKAISEKDKEIKNAEDDYKKLEDKISKYDELREDMEDLVDDIDELTQQQIEIRISKFRMDVEIRLKMGQAEREWNKFRREVLEHTDIIKDSDFDKLLKDTQQNYNDIYSYFNVQGSAGSIEALTNQILSTRQQIESINNTGTSSIYGNDKAKAMEDLQNDLNNLMSQMEDIQGLIDNIDQAYLSTIDDIEENFNKQIEDYQYVGELIQHDMDLLTLLYGDRNYDAMNKYYTTLQQNNEKQLDSLRQQRDFWKAQWDDAVARGDSQAAKKFEENYKNTLNNLNSTIEEAAKTLQEKYENSINKIFDTLDKKISNGFGTDYLSTEWQLMNKNADEYLDTINSAFAIQDTQRKYQKAIDETKNIKNQQALKKLMDQQLDILKNKNKLSEYDVERAEKMLQIEQARIALEDAQSSKTSLRLKRDSQGNYSYQYAADQGAIGEAESNLAKAQNDLYNFDKDRYKSVLDSMLSAWKDFQSEYKDILLDTSLSEEQRIQRLALLREQYGEYINNKTEDNLSVRTNLTQSAFGDIAAIYQTDVANYNKMSEDEKNILMSNLVPMWESGIQQMSDKVAGQGGFISACEDAFKNVTDSTRQYKEELERMASSAGINLSDVRSGIDEVSMSMSYLITDNSELIGLMSQEISTISSLRAEAQLLVGTYKAVYSAAKEAVTGVQNFMQSQQKDAAETSSSFLSQPVVEQQSPIISQEILSDQDLDFQQKMAADKKAAQQLKKKKNKKKVTKSVWGSQYASGIAHLDNGGYTGNWNSNDGRLAILHEKQLVLNKEDTENFLNGINVLRQLRQSLNGEAFFKLGNLSSINKSSNSYSGNNEMEQNVHISATFPNVNSKREIEEAFSELVNLAAQRAMRS